MNGQNMKQSKISVLIPTLNTKKLLIQCIKHLKKLAKYKQGIRLDAGCGLEKQEGFFGIDLLPPPQSKADLVWDLEDIPYPLPDNIAEIILASHIVEHINPHKGKFIDVMNEWWRIMKPDGKLMIATPYAGSFGYFQDPTHCNPCNEATWNYFDPETNPQTDPDRLWGFYKPKPWKIVQNVWKSYGNIEILLEKREDKKEYYDNS